MAITIERKRGSGHRSNPVITVGKVELAPCYVCTGDFWCLAVSWLADSDSGLFAMTRGRDSNCLEKQYGKGSIMKVLNPDTELARVARVQRVLSVDKGANPAHLLRFRDTFER